MLTVEKGKAIGTLSEILGFAFSATLAGIKASPVDVSGVSLTWSGTTWSGVAGRFRHLYQVLVLPKSRVAAGTIFEVSAAKYVWDGAALVQVGTSTNWYEPGVVRNPDGSISMPGPVQAPNVPLYPQVTTPRTVTQRLRGDGMRVALHGSSTLAAGSTYHLLGGTAGDRKICANSLIWALNAEGAEIDEIWNGAFSGDKTGSISTKFRADWDTIKDLYDVHVYAPAFNNLTDPADDLSASKPIIVSDITRMIRYGKRVIWILPFAGNPLSYPGVTHQKYQEYIAWAYATIESIQAYRGQIIPWNLYNIFNLGGVDLPLQYAGEKTPFAQHLNSVGVIYAARHPSSLDVIRTLQVPRTEGAAAYGTPVAALDMTTATAGAGATIVSAGSDPDTGEPMYDIPSTVALSYITTAAITVNTAKVYRLVGEYELTTLKTADGNDYVDGVKWEDPVAQRIGIYPWINGNSTAYSKRVTGRVKVFGPKWAPNDTSGAIRLFPGPPGATVRVRGNTPIRLYEVPA